MSTENRYVTAEQVIHAPAEKIFEYIADPAKQPEWDGNDNLESAPEGQRITAVGQSFLMNLTNGQQRNNEIIEFDEGRLIAWKPAPVGETARGHIFGWELQPQDDSTTLVRHFYDWRGLTDETRFERARAYTSEALNQSITNLKNTVSS